MKKVISKSISKQDIKPGKATKRPRKLLIAAGISALLVCSLVILAGCVGNGEVAQQSAEPEPEPIINPLTGLEVDEELPSRPVMFSIDNVGDAIPQSYISKADLVYEFPVEGLQTRLQAIYYSEFPEFFGPVRSVRPYFVDLAREYGAIYVAHGWSGDAKSYLHSDVVPYLNAMEDGDKFYRVSDKESPHDSYIKWETVKEVIDENGWWEGTGTVKGFKFKSADEAASSGDASSNADQAGSSETASGNDTYAAQTAEASGTVDMNDTAGTTDTSVADNGDNSTSGDTDDTASESDDASADEDGQSDAAEDNSPEIATEIEFHYAYSQCEFKYDEEKNKYKRYDYGSEYIDKETGKQVKVSNVLVQKVSSDVLDDKGRLEIDMTADGKALLFTGGTVIKGTWSRAGLDDQTRFFDKSGNEFELTPGRTWVEVIDQNCDLDYDD